MFEVESTNYLTCGYTRHTHDLSVREREREKTNRKRKRECFRDVKSLTVEPRLKT